MTKVLPLAAVAALVFSTSAFAQSAGNGLNSPAEQSTLTKPQHRTNSVNNGMGEGRANAPDTPEVDENSAHRGSTANGNNKLRTDGQ